MGRGGKNLDGSSSGYPKKKGFQKKGPRGLDPSRVPAPRILTHSSPLNVNEEEGDHVGSAKQDNPGR